MRGRMPGRVHGAMTAARAGAASVSLLACALASCGGEPSPRAPEPAHEEAASRPAPRPALQTRSELGSVDPGAIKRAFHELDGEFLGCQKKALDRVEVLAGSVKIFLRISESGRAKYAYLEDGDLGDRATEKCLLDYVLGAPWPKPDSGEAEARYGMDLPMQSTRPATDWSADRVTAALAKHAADLDRCKAGVGATFRATMYVGPGGKVLSAGVTTSNKEGDAKLDCLSDALVRLKGLPSPGSWPAKVSFPL